MKTLFKKTLLAITIAGLSLTQVQAQAPGNVKEIRDELSIMLNILQATLKQNSNKTVGFRANAVTYLANQGVMFEINASRQGQFFGFDFSDMLNNLKSMRIPPAPQVNEQQIVININGDEMEHEFSNSYEYDVQLAEERHEKMRELSERQRDLAWEQREYERSRRDLEFEKRNAEGDRRKEIEQELAELSTELKKIEAKRTELEKYSSEIAAEQSKLAEQRQAAKKQLYSQSLAVFEDTVGKMLCRYGAGLKSLDEDENINFVLSNFIEAEDKSSIVAHDKIYVFKHKDVKACVSGRKSQEQLLASATTYLF